MYNHNYIYKMKTKIKPNIQKLCCTYPKGRTGLRIVLAVVVCLLIALPAVAQQKVSYDYDMTGNRISRRIINLPQSAPKNKDEQPEPIKDELGDRKITIYPNPTKGALAVDIQGGDEKDELRAIVFDANGKQILNTTLAIGSTSLDMNRFPAAWYILRITAGGKITEYKIIKQ